MGRYPGCGHTGPPPRGSDRSPPSTLPRTRQHGGDGRPARASWTRSVPSTLLLAHAPKAKQPSSGDSPEASDGLRVPPGCREPGPTRHPKPWGTPLHGPDQRLRKMTVFCSLLTLTHQELGPSASPAAAPAQSKLGQGCTWDSHTWGLEQHPAARGTGRLGPWRTLALAMSAALGTRPSLGGVGHGDSTLQEGRLGSQLRLPTQPLQGEGIRPPQPTAGLCQHLQSLAGGM